MLHKYLLNWTDSLKEICSKIEQRNEAIAGFDSLSYRERVAFWHFTGAQTSN